MLVTYYDDANRVVWVDELFVENAVRPQRSEPFDMLITPASEIKTLLVKEKPTTVSSEGGDWRERVKLPEGLGYSSLRVSVHFLSGGTS